MSMADLIRTAREIRQSHKPKAEKHPVEVITEETAHSFNELLGESKKRCPKSRPIITMQPAAASKTQLSGLLAKLDILEESLQAENSAS